MNLISRRQGRNATDLPQISYDRLAAETDIVGYPVLPLIRQLSAAVPEAHSGFIHWGATTQDIMDTASILQMRSGLELVERELKDLIEIMKKLATEHRDT